MKIRSIKNRTNNSMITDINIVPFTDIVLVLLIIFMIATPLIYQNRFKVNLPQVNTVQSQDKPLKIEASITEQGDVYIDKTKYSISNDLKELKNLISKMAGSSNESAIVISGDRNCRYDHIIQVIDTAKEAGIKRIMLSTELRK